VRWRCVSECGCVREVWNGRGGACEVCGDATWGPPVLSAPLGRLVFVTIRRGPGLAVVLGWARPGQG
jgi:hypothetical protein